MANYQIKNPDERGRDQADLQRDQPIIMMSR